MNAGCFLRDGEFALDAIPKHFSNGGWLIMHELIKPWWKPIEFMEGIFAGTPSVVPR